MNRTITEIGAGDAEVTALPFWSHYNTAAGIDWSYRRFALLARNDTEVLGALVYSFCGGVAHLGQVIVDPNHQRQGHARALVLAFESKCAERGSHRITLEVAAFQAPDFFAKLGYSKRATFENDKYHATWYRYEKDLPANAFAK
jgi:ribosomal protein S18 acetylase RimI-like enzyme